MITRGAMEITKSTQRLPLYWAHRQPLLIFFLLLYSVWKREETLGCSASKCLLWSHTTSWNSIFGQFSKHHLALSSHCFPNGPGSLHAVELFWCSLSGSDSMIWVCLYCWTLSLQLVTLWRCRQFICFGSNVRKSSVGLKSLHYRIKAKRWFV